MSESSEVVFVLSKKDGFSTGAVPASSSGTNSNIIQETEESIESEYVLSMIWKGGTLGASYYDITTKQLFILTDTIDPNPEFSNTRGLLRHIKFKHVITMGNPCDNFVKLIIDWINNKGDGVDETVDSDQIRHVPPSLSLLPMTEFSFSACEIKIFTLNLPGIPKSDTDPNHETYFHSLIDFNNRLSIHSLGALIKFIDMSWAYLVDDTVPNVKFLHINQITMENQIYITNNTIQALQIFQKRSHDAKFKHGSECGNKEGSSVYKLFVQNCNSDLSINRLRRLLLSPLKDIKELNKRLDFVKFAYEVENAGLIDALQENIRKLQDIDRIIIRIQHSRASSNDWQILYKTIYNTLYIQELCIPYKNEQIFSELISSISEDLYVIENCIRDSLEFSNRNSSSCRPVIKPGVDEELDKRKLLREDMGKYLTAAANFTVNQLPDYLDECTVVYIPEIGHLLALRKTEHNSRPEQLEYLGLQFMFEIHDSFHYKNAMCKELDKHLGQLQNEIIEHEIRIIQRLSGLILKSIKIIREPIRIITLIDCLISMAKVAKENNYVRPQLNTDNILEIKDGRHALFEMQSDNFVPNDYISGVSTGRVKIISGPNSCGKSVFLKQIGLLVYLAHVGSFVPASSANICIMHTIHTGMKVKESAWLPLSALMIDLTQMARAFNTVTANSLILIDEFGKSTSGQDGTALLAATIKHFMKDDQCPHVLVATHFQQIKEILPSSPLLSYLTFDFTKNNDDVIFLFKLIDGISAGSFALDVALAVGLDKSVVDRAREIYQAISNGTDWTPANNCNLQSYDVNYYLNIDIPPLDEDN